MREDSQRTFLDSALGSPFGVVDHVHLVDIRRHAEDLRTRLVQKVQGQGGLVDLGPIVNAAARQNDTDLCHNGPPACRGFFHKDRGREKPWHGWMIPANPGQKYR